MSSPYTGYSSSYTGYRSPYRGYVTADGGRFSTVAWRSSNSAYMQLFHPPTYNRYQTMVAMNGFNYYYYTYHPYAYGLAAPHEANVYSGQLTYLRSFLHYSAYYSLLPYRFFVYHMGQAANVQPYYHYSAYLSGYAAQIYGTPGLRMPSHQNFVAQNNDVPARAHFHMNADDDASYEEFPAPQPSIGIVSNGLTRQTIEKHLGRCKYETNPNNSETETDCCPICLADFVDGHEISKLECMHLFHFRCIKKWLLKKNECPMCKRRGLAT